VRADPEDQLRLLELARLDAELDRCAHRLRTLPALEVIAAADREISRLDREAVDHETRAADLGRAQRKLEGDVEQVRARSERDQARLDSGAVNSARDLSSLQAEIGSLHRRQGALEDELLELMEQREQAEAELAAVVQAREARAAERAGAVAERDRDSADIEAQAARVGADRDTVAAAVPAELRALYQRLRADKGGVAAAALVRRRCEGCHLELSGAELGVVRDAPAEEVLRCEECGRILVRTAESGLG
jgi:predicted  nucleic acid-binding Zn-ribbon protein